MTEPVTYGLLRSARRSAVHLEVRDTYAPENGAWRDWYEGRGVEPAGRAQGWFDLVKATTMRGVRVRRARVVSEPVTDYIRWEHQMTSRNLEAGEEVRWLPRHEAAHLLLPPVDFWVIDDQVVVFNHHSGDAAHVWRQLQDDADVVRQCADAFETVWTRATPHADYQPATPAVTRVQS